MKITKIVITGGPCAGKTTAMSRIQRHFTAKGYMVLFIPETATELISGGVAPWTCGSNLDYQQNQCELQLAKEKVFEQAARTMHADKILIVCDRGFMDNRAYMNETEFAAVLDRLQTSEVERRNSYDAVFHLVTAARGAEEAYTTANNAARYETIPEAIEIDDRLLSAWIGHPHLSVIDNGTDFENKIRRLLAEIDHFLGEPEPFKIKRKFLIRYPDIRWLEAQQYCRRVEIKQIYMRAEEGTERRVRRVGVDGHYTYYETVKKAVSAIKRIQSETRLTADEYSSRVRDADPAYEPLHKTRYYLTYENQYLQIDLFPFWQDQAICEAELRSEDEAVHIPEELTVIREVTGEEDYRNSTLARK